MCSNNLSLIVSLTIAEMLRRAGSGRRHQPPLDPILVCVMTLFDLPPWSGWLRQLLRQFVHSGYCSVPRELWSMCCSLPVSVFKWVIAASVPNAQIAATLCWPVFLSINGTRSSWALRWCRSYLLSQQVQPCHWFPTGSMLTAVTTALATFVFLRRSCNASEYLIGVFQQVASVDSSPRHPALQMFYPRHRHTNLKFTAPRRYRCHIFSCLQALAENFLFCAVISDFEPHPSFRFYFLIGAFVVAAFCSHYVS